MSDSLSLESLVSDVANALSELDSERPIHKHFQAGIGPFSETEITKLVFSRLRDGSGKQYSSARSKRTPDWLIPDEWMLEFKILRPFGDNGKEAEHWSQNLLHPYEGNTSAIGDSLKLSRQEGVERKGVIVIGYEHDPAQISLEPCLLGFEHLVQTLFDVNLSSRASERRGGLVHPVHQVVVVCGWQLLGA